MTCADCSIARPAEPPAAARGAGPHAALTIVELSAHLQRLQPPVPYRLSLDTGIGYKNVRRALQAPMAVRVQTWARLLGSLQLCMVAAHPGVAGAAPHVAFAADTPAAVASGVRGYRLALGWSRRTLAQRAGMGLDAVVSLEGGGGLLRSLLLACHAMGLQLRVALPADHASLEQLWEARAGSCLAAPAQFRVRSAPAWRPRRKWP